MSARSMRLIPRKWWSPAAWRRARSSERMVTWFVDQTLRGFPGLEFQVTPTGQVREVGEYVYMDLSGYFRVHVPTVLAQAVMEDTPETRQRILDACYRLAEQLGARSEILGVH